MPAVKKDASVRARRNVSPTRATIGAATVVPIRDRPKLPVLTDAKGAVVKWHPQVVSWWTDIWSSPMSGQWHSSDRHRLFRMALLSQRIWTGATTMGLDGLAKLMAELRQQEQDFGLAPYARRRLEWTIEQVEEAQDRGTRRRQTAAEKAKAAAASKRASKAPDPRRNLRAV